jgi:hypothetical protein
MDKNTLYPVSFALQTLANGKFQITCVCRSGNVVRTAK